MTTFTFDGVSQGSTAPDTTLTLVTRAGETPFSYTRDGGFGDPVIFDFTNAYDISITYGETVYSMSQIITSDAYVYDIEWDDEDKNSTVLQLNVDGTLLTYTIDGDIIDDYVEMEETQESLSLSTGTFGENTNFGFGDMTSTTMTENDSLLGSLGDDFYYLGDGDDIVVGRDGNDTFYGGEGNDDIQAGRGRDDIRGGGGEDLIRGGSGADHIEGGGETDIIYGGSSHDDIFGGGGVDILRGGSGGDYLVGGLGNDRLFGNQGDDEIEGGVGDDVLSGGSQNDPDFFIFESGAGTDRILDFQAHLDVLVFFGGITFEDLQISEAGGDVDIYYGSDHIILKGVSLADLSEANYSFDEFPA